MSMSTMSRADNSKLANWWWTIDRVTLMAVLMLMSQQGGMSFGSGARNKRQIAAETAALVALAALHNNDRVGMLRRIASGAFVSAATIA